MLEHDNDSLERFFQKAAREPKIDFNENDWRKLEAKLDAEAVRLSSAHQGRWRLGAVSVGAVLILIGIIYFSGHNQNQPYSSSNNSPIDAISENSSIIIMLDSSSKQKRDAVASLGVNVRPLAKEVNGLVEKENGNKVFLGQKIKPANSSAKPQEKNRAGRDVLSPYLPQDTGGYADDFKNPKPNNLSNQSQGTRSKKGAEENNLPSTQNEALPIEAIGNGVPQSAIGGKIKEGMAVPFSSQGDSVNLLPAEKDKPVVGQAEISSHEDSVHKNQEAILPSRWSLVLSFAPDFSSIGIGQYTSPGKAFGLMAHYHLNNTLSVSAGIIRSNKKYWGYGSEYQRPVGYWQKNTNGIVPEKIQGACEVLEIPLMLQYKVVKMNRSRMLVTAGFSSYIMLNESYRFAFENPNPGATEGWNSSGTSRSLFSIANVSVGYERDILPHLALGLEPYIKIPVSGIGWSDIKLFSMGASVTLRYSLQKKKHPSSPTQSRGPD